MSKKNVQAEGGECEDFERREGYSYRGEEGEEGGGERDTYKACDSNWSWGESIRCKASEHIL